ncbi:2-amino-4-hydroxy-6-hydroxymethyldihydropteridine diphosphokinase, partial [Enterococcus faecium]|uniref:2-amino-4-hydroxy-6- hydroxymethyldihydropteridine diphosphokinase n=1 Tax=Enterococcus faecium TaxID=1352 RepID=UPI001C0F1654
NLALARKRLSELFPNIRFSAEADTEPLFFRRQALFANQVARFTSDSDAGEVILHLKDIEREATYWLSQLVNLKGYWFVLCSLYILPVFFALKKRFKQQYAVALVLFVCSLSF